MSIKADLIERVARSMRFSMRPDGFEYDNSDEAWAKVPDRAKDYWRDFARTAVEIVAAQWDRNPEGEKPQALSAEHESPVAEGDAPNPTP